MTHRTAATLTASTPDGGGDVFLNDRVAHPSVALVDIDPVTGKARLSYRWSAGGCSTVTAVRIRASSTV
ncbi:MAG TPA: hypothetical protein VGO16_13840 [Pseudonocardiaceae bacterium]|nr:hypothetical protein [Pseudonocardiaceae bacterium]